MKDYTATWNSSVMVLALIVAILFIVQGFIFGIFHSLGSIPFEGAVTLAYILAAMGLIAAYIFILEFLTVFYSALKTVGYGSIARQVTTGLLVGTSLSFSYIIYFDWEAAVRLGLVVVSLMTGSAILLTYSSELSEMANEMFGIRGETQ